MLPWWTLLVLAHHMLASKCQGNSGIDRVVLAGRKLIGRKPVNLIVSWCGRFLFFVVPCHFSQDTGYGAKF